MTIKHLKMNVSAENETVIKEINLLPNGILKVIKKNLFNDYTSGEQDSDYLDLKNIKLKILTVTQQELDALEISDDDDDINLRETNIFLVPLNTNGDDEYKEMIWSEDKEGFEQIGTTKLELDTKENISNKVSSWSNVTTHNHYPTEKLVKDSLDGKAESVHYHSTNQITGLNIPTDITDLEGVSVEEFEITYGNNLTERIKFLIYDEDD